MILDRKTARVFTPLRQPNRYKAAYGGRGGGKSQFFAEEVVWQAVKRPGLRVLCVREIQRSLNESAKRLIEDKIRALGAPGFDPQRDLIKTPGGGVIVFQGMRDHTAETVKSFEGFDVAWVEEAASLSARSLQLLRPTIRKPGSELWFSWNPRRKSDAVDLFMRGEGKPDNAIVVPVNYDSNPWFPAELEAERQHDLKYSPSYRHIWEGDYATVVDGAYYASALHQARAEGRITELAYDPVLERRAYWDLGYSDATTIWIAQFKGQRIYAMDYIEGQGQELSYYITELRRRGHGDALCFLPHDGAHHHVGKSVQEHLTEADFRVKTVRNGGRGEAMRRVEATRRMLPRVWFNTPACDGGIEALGSYHERRDEGRQIGLGPEHDWASHAADSFGLLCQLYEEPKASLKPESDTVYSVGSGSGGGTGWMGN